MALLDTVKTRLGVFYSEANKDAEIQGMINGALHFLKGAGWNIDPASPSDSAIDAITIYCKMSQSTDPSDFKINDMLVALTAQGRAEAVT